MLFRTLLALIVVVLTLQSCVNNKSDQLYPCDITNVKYSTFVSQVISTNCLGCHSEANKASGNSIVLDNYSDLKVMAASNRLVPAINHTGPHPMPQGSAKLDECTIAKITAWVNDGIQNN
jgi:hypothetical protein